MTYFPDLSPYEYFKRLSKPGMLNIGWLHKDHDFPRGSIPGEALNTILHLCCCCSVNHARGFHKSPYRVIYREKTCLLGSAEIHVPGKNGVIYAAPNLIYHFIKDCNYRPAQEFIDAVLDMEIPDYS
jgi:hypothetical protein